MKSMRGVNLLAGRFNKPKLGSALLCLEQPMALLNAFHISQHRIRI